MEIDDQKSHLVCEGKTKIVRTMAARQDLVVIESKNDITAFDDPSKTKQFAMKAKYATNTTCRVFELLKAVGIPVAYERQASDTEFIARNCKMIPLEVIARRYAVGSYLKRYPNMNRGEGLPHRFHNLKIEFFLKTTKGELKLNSGDVIKVNVAAGEEDPFILDYKSNSWKLYHSKKPTWDPTACLRNEIFADVLLDPYNANASIREIEEITRKTFLVLESAWAQQNMRLIDYKIEFGRDKQGKLMIADVIDNDSWRLRDFDWKEVSKESFRQGEALDEVEKKYGIVSRMVDNFRLPKQCIVLWTGSASDEAPRIPGDLIGLLDVECVIMSGHKSPQNCLDKLEELLSIYPEGGVIIVKVGRSNGLAPVLAARTNWPVIAVPATLKEFSEDVWSGLRMPSDVPLMTMWPEENAVLGALNILAQKNPAIYLARQYRIEKLDI